MRSLSLLGSAVVLGLWVSAIAILAVQNAEPVSLRFLSLQSIQFPIGLILALSATAGILGGTLIQVLEINSKSIHRQEPPRTFSSDDIDF